jgi:hypothetical protein
MLDNLNKQILAINKRLERLEKIVLVQKQSSHKAITPSRDKFSGAKGGILFLISKNYFSVKRGAKEVMEKLVDNGYHYHILFLVYYNFFIKFVYNHRSYR